MTHHENALSQERRREVDTEAAEHILGPNSLVGVRGQDLFQTASALVKQAVKQPQFVLAHGLTLAAEAARIAGGSSRLAPDAKDRRFQNPSWRENEVYRRSLQLYLAANNELHDLLGAIPLEGDERRRAQFMLSLLSDALAPSNSALNPEALKRFLETGGESTVRGLRHLLSLQPVAGRPARIHPEHQRAHPEHSQPARQLEGDLFHQY